MTSSHPDDYTFTSTGYGDVGLELSTLISTYPPPFIYIHDSSDGLKVNARHITNLLQRPSEPSQEHGPITKVCFGWADAACCFTQRLLFEALIHSLVGHSPDWDEECANWALDNGSQWNDNLDSFLHGIREAHTHLSKRFGVDSTGAVQGTNRKGKGKEQQYTGIRIVLVVARAERLKDSMPELMVSLARLRELVRLDLCVVLSSEVEWDKIKPPLGAAPDPYFVDIPPLTKEDAVSLLTARYPALTSENPTLYHPSLKSLYSHFVAVLCDVCYLYTHDPHELQYIAAARWPGFVKPVLDEHRSQMDNESEEGQRDIEPPSEDVRLRLTRLFSSSLSLALEALYPRLTDASEWAKVNEPPSDLLSKPPAEAKVTTASPTFALGTDSLLGHLPRLSKFILVASFLASTNPAKSDVRMFGRGLDEKKRRRRKAQATLKPKGGVSKVPQRLLGPSPFPLDRLIALLGALLEEHDVESRLPAPEFTIPGEYTDMEVSRVAINAAVQELSSSRLMHRTTKAEQIDGPAMFKCAISYDLALALSKELKIPLPDLLWEQV